MSAMPKLGISLEKTNFFEIDWAYAAFWHTAFLILQQTSNQKRIINMKDLMKNLVIRAACLNVAMRRMEKKEMLIILLISIVLAVAISWMIQWHGGMSDQRWLHPGNFGL